jgi:hypothetical protein
MNHQETYTLYRTQPGTPTQNVFQIPTEVNPNLNTLTIPSGSVPAAIPAPSGLGSSYPSPGAVAAVNGTVCWTYEGVYDSTTMTTSPGAVACLAGGASVVVAPQATAPQSLALGVDATGTANAVYWVSFGASANNGGIFKGDLPTPAATPSLVVAEEYPSGLVIDPTDGQTLYWTSRSRGTVMALRPGSTTPLVLAKGQLNPGAITADADSVYWVDEGTGALDGAVLKIAKP